ncbi:hypothetical protein ASG84_01315 [Rhodococcus sp. Leaf278]|uniref:hypothetical protein n=1 Tax=Rhodococcus sp. Leaf278 TaxID=1736319 RepID=UPI0007091E2C|nr:hypothetical protein [Rhodococcus sp. Leaf278]KQU61201.1 hypothetical protein ASG84_01315 [Rhodococcus sp. Leaf278]
MNARDDRRAELIAAAVADDLDDTESAELRELAASDPTVDIDIAELRALTETVGSRGPAGPWLEFSASPDLRERVLGSTGDSVWPPRDRGKDAPRFGGRRRSTGLMAAAAVVGLVVGGGVVLGVDAFRAKPEQPAAAITGPPGTLGAYEQVAFTTSRPNVDIEGGLVAHTWGTETFLDMDGISERGPYEVVLVDRSGTELPSGTFLGSDVTIECRMNAAVLRGDVTEIEIRSSDGSVLASAQLPNT